jgi:hypothetical protein
MTTSNTAPFGALPDPKTYSDGIFRVPIQAEGEKVILEIHNDTPNPCALVSCEWVGMLFGKARLL